MTTSPRKRLLRCLSAALLGIAAYAPGQDGGVANTGASPASYEDAMTAIEQRLRDPASSAAARAEEARVAIQGAIVLRGGHEYEHALSLLLRARQHVPRSAELLLDLALLEDEMHLYADADDAAAAALQLAPDDPGAIYTEARIKMDLQQMAAAETAMRHYLTLRPGDASAHYGMGRIYRSEARNDEAQAEFQRSLASQPKQAESNYQLGELALERGDRAAAAQCYDRALAIDPRHAGALTGKAMLAYREAKYEDADTLLKAAEAAAPGFDKAHYARGLVLGKLGRKEEAEQEFAEALRLQAEERRKGRRLAEPPGDQGPPESPEPPGLSNHP